MEKNKKRSQSVKFSVCFAQDSVSYVQKRQKGNITSKDIDITRTRLGLVFLMVFSTWTLVSSYSEIPLGEHINAHVKDTNFFLNYRWIHIIYDWQPFTFLTVIQTFVAPKLIFPAISDVIARRSQHRAKICLLYSTFSFCTSDFKD